MTAYVGDARIEHNRILACLPSKERKILKDSFELVSLHPKEELSELDTPVRYLHFPVGSAISLMNLQSGGAVVEAAVVGMEGCTGFTVVQGYMNAPCRVMVQVGGRAFRLPASTLTKALPQLSFMRYALSRFSVTILRQAIISVGCSQFHSVEPFTHDFLAEQLGVQRATISEALAGLQDKKIIKYAYRQVEVRNAPGMQRLSCECFPAAMESIDAFLRDIENYRN
jgi:hypothetical protein